MYSTCHTKAGEAHGRTQISVTVTHVRCATHLPSCWGSPIETNVNPSACTAQGRGWVGQGRGGGRGEGTWGRGEGGWGMGGMGGAGEGVGQGRGCAGQGREWVGQRRVGWAAQGRGWGRRQTQQTQVEAKRYISGADIGLGGCVETRPVWSLITMPQPIRIVVERSCLRNSCHFYICGEQLNSRHNQLVDGHCILFYCWHTLFPADTINLLIDGHYIMFYCWHTQFPAEVKNVHNLFLATLFVSASIGTLCSP